MLVKLSRYYFVDEPGELIRVVAPFRSPKAGLDEKDAVGRGRSQGIKGFQRT